MPTPVDQHKNKVNDNSNQLFPVFLKLDTLELLIVGAGNVGHEKLKAILQNATSAQITVVAREISPEIKKLLKDQPHVRLVQKDFEEQDLEKKDLVFVAVNDLDTSRRIRALAKTRRLLVNVADTPDLCDFYLGGIVQKGDVRIAISTNGKSPTLAKRLKEVLDEVLPADLHQLANNLNSIRNQLKGIFSQKVKQLNELTSSLLLEKK